ncbi:MAG: hypothetical protein ACU85E_03575 [Gammaproteobacteria bacterium]
MKTSIPVILLSGLFLQACENAPVRRQEIMAMHPEWDKEYVQLIQAGYLARGMDQDQVRAAWGRPCWSCTGTTKGEWGEAWEYATQVVFFDRDGKVTRWEAK